MILVGETVFHPACMYGLLWLVKDLIEKGADVNESDSSLGTPLHHADLMNFLQKQVK
jgi:ankyrin repeat protein